MRMTFFRPSPESSHPEALHEAVMDSVSSVRDSIPEQYHTHFDTLRQEIIDFTKAHGIPRESLGKPDLLREATKKLSTPDLERLALLLERFEYLLKNGEPKKEDHTEALEYTEKYYHLKEQYDSQVELLEQVGILKEGALLGIDGKKYPIPTLEQIASRLFERHEELSTKHDQGFTKLLLVPFGMSLDVLQEVLKQFLLDYKKKNPDFDLDTDNPLYTSEEYQGADDGDFPKLVYYPQSFDKKNHQGKTKIQILEKQEDNQDFFPGWTIHLLQPSNQGTQDTKTPQGFAFIPRKGQGISEGDFIPRLPLQAGKTEEEYLSILKDAKEDKGSPYHHESSLTPEDWIMAFMLHLEETGRPLDNAYNHVFTESVSYLAGAFFRSSILVPYAYWSHDFRKILLNTHAPHSRNWNTGLRSSVIV
ncbi:TPA: hypothetical protein DEP34_03865 [Candidatus Uhrbacteria bacterium]|uniref:Uncharacterized protein n=2 Tax=Candidatus Uhriibacteriota TaxID=1752732 RepID=A0A0G1Q9Q9_9BACT|nr:MAG: hypothetical protein UX45_C0022G0002 [Candidatus Uhrbacteria bacterium GW2011_GWF2_46_218]KKU41552.1 MAG: hypothetical protein UX57_C0003G0052 [Candidatus Uhrbacteria bacterium GW2011_GWE2_46_68]HBK33554.1 hypothetical protein [Candidatus Uhrbacteria bacterium]HCB19491.1 hypothetical protein [Candidatus Uhrbacteria bacterium]